MFQKDLRKNEAICCEKISKDFYLIMKKITVCMGQKVQVKPDVHFPNLSMKLF